MTDIDIDAIRQREQAADRGPWTAHPDGLVWSQMIGDPVSGSVLVENAEFIAHARTDVPALLAKVDELTAALATVEQQRDSHYRDFYEAHQNWQRVDAALTQSHEQAATYANEIGSLKAELEHLREQVFVQKPVVEAAEAWAEMCEDGDCDDTRKVEDALHDAIEQHRLMDTALTSARAEQPAAAR